MKKGNAETPEQGQEVKDTQLIWGPYTLDFRKKILRRLLKVQNEVRELGPDPQMSLISEDEVHEIRRLWRLEEGDWEDSVPTIYEEVTGETIPWIQDAFGAGTSEESMLLQAVANEHELLDVIAHKLIPYRLYLPGLRKG